MYRVSPVGVAAQGVDADCDLRLFGINHAVGGEHDLSFDVARRADGVVRKVAVRQLLVDAVQRLGAFRHGDDRYTAVCRLGVGRLLRRDSGHGSRGGRGCRLGRRRWRWWRRLCLLGRPNYRMRRGDERQENSRYQYRTEILSMRGQLRNVGVLVQVYYIPCFGRPTWHQTVRFAARSTVSDIHALRLLPSAFAAEEAAL